MMTLYHGSYLSVPNPLTGVGRRELDFGPGFYVTKLQEQAERWARRVCVIRAVNTPIISSYTFDQDSLPAGTRILRLEHYDQEWLDFIVDSRKGKQPWSGYDIIEGGVADDRVIDAVEAYINGYADVEHTLRQLVYHKPNYQICILSQEIVDKYLQFKSYERI